MAKHFKESPDSGTPPGRPGAVTGMPRRQVGDGRLDRGLAAVALTPTRAPVPRPTIGRPVR